jgi:hypothetical protein
MVEERGPAQDGDEEAVRKGFEICGNPRREPSG